MHSKIFVSILSAIYFCSSVSHEILTILLSATMQTYPRASEIDILPQP